jgi:potassium-transporting ATPase KdpC subunit
MLTHLRRSVIFALFCLVVFGFVYALAGTGVSQLFFGHQANGSITANGSTLIGQNWSTPMWFHGRPDDAGPYAAVVCSANAKNCTPAAGGDNPLVNNGVSGESGASNLGPRSQTLLDNTKELVAFWHSMGVNPTPDLVTTSGSGYDPDISPQDATVQIPMVAKARGLAASTLQALINRHTQSAELGFLGSSYVNVLQLNEGLAKLH